MDHPNILFRVKHDTSKQGKVFGQQTYDRIRQQLSNLLSAPYTLRLKDVWCDNPEHHSFETSIIIVAADKTYEIEKVCCKDYEDKINKALIGVENER
jgi:hypothetical protein